MKSKKTYAKNVKKVTETKLHEYEITLEYVGRKKPFYVDSEYGFSNNPPIVIHAKNKKEAIAQLRLPKTVKVAEIIKVT